MSSLMASLYLEGVVGAAVVEVVAEAGDEERQRLQLRDHAAPQQVKALDQLASDASVMENNLKQHWVGEPFKVPC